MKLIVVLATFTVLTAAALAAQSPFNTYDPWFPCPHYLCYLPPGGCDAVIPGHPAEGPCPCPLCVNFSPAKRSNVEPRCREVECSRPSCAAGEEIYIPEGRCCYECRTPLIDDILPPGCPPPYLNCLDPQCEPEEDLWIPEGKCCPICVFNVP